MTKESFFRKGTIVKSAAVSCLLVGFVCGLVLLMNMNVTEVISSVGQRGWNTIVSADTGNGPLAAGVSGFCYFMTVAHSADPATDYSTNYTNASAFEHSFYLDQEMDGETPYSTAFDFLLKFRVNTTVGWNTSGSCWEDSWVRANLTCNFDFASDIGPLAAMTIVQIVNTTQYAWYHAYMNNAAAGYQIAKNEKFNCTAIQAEGYY